MRRKTKIARWGTAAVAAALTLATAAACTSSPSSTPSKSATASPSSSGTLAGYPRAQTLYTSGTMYTPPTNWNPFNVGNYATGAQGLIYEPLFLFDPDQEQLHPVAGLERDMVGQHVHDQGPGQREVEQRAAANRR